MKQHVDWRAFCRDHGVAMSGEVRKGQWLEVRCPFCNDHHSKGAVNLKSNAYTCWKCGKHRVTEFVSAVCGIPDSYRDAMQVLRPYFTEVYAAPVSKKQEEEPYEVRVHLHERGLTMPGTSPLSHDMRAYLRGRGFRAKYIEKKYGLLNGGIAGDWAYRIMIPVYLDGKLVTWQGRHIGDNKIRYRSASNDIAMNIKDTLYNIDNCHHKKVLVVEGVFDCWRFGDDCVAVFGISFKDAQAKFIADRFEEAYILFDWGEVEAQNKAKELCRKLTALGCKSTVLRVDDTSAGDPAELCPSEIMEVKHYIFHDVPNYDYSTPWIL